MLGNRRLKLIHCAFALSAICAYLACKEEETRPGGVPDCGDDCSGGPSPIRPPAAGGQGMGGGGGSDGGGSAGSATAGAAGSSMEAGSLSGSIQAVVAADLTQNPDLDGTVQVQAPGASGDQVSTTSDANG